MFRNTTLLLCVLTAVSFCAGSFAIDLDEQVSGTIIGNVGQVLEIRLSHPVREGTVFEVRPIVSEPSIAEARVMSCTKEPPIIALAKIVKVDPRTSIPIGAKAFADLGSVQTPNIPATMPVSSRSEVFDARRFSAQTGSFYPRLPVLRDTVAHYWQEYRLNYSFLRLRDFDAVLSAQYARGSGDFPSSNGTTRRTMEIIPLTVLGRFKLAQIGSTRLVVGAGGGGYRIRSEERAGTAVTSDSTDKLGYEFSGSLESRGWTLELRYKEVPDTLIQGFSLAIGGRF